jgi:Tfp pilus assembly protein PilN
VNKWHEHRQLVATLKDSQASLSQRFDQLELRDRDTLRDIDRHDLSTILVKADKANELIRWKAFSWTELFNHLQEVLPGNVQMSSIHPVFRVERRNAPDAVEDLSKVPVAVEGIAKSLVDFLEFERNLIGHPHFAHPEPDRWNTDENSNETVFRVRFLYDPLAEEHAESPEQDQLAEAEGTEADTPALTEEDEPTIAEVSSGDGEGEEAAGIEVPEPTGELATDQLTKIDRGGTASNPAEEADSSPAANDGNVRTPGPEWGTRRTDAGDDADELEGERH